MKKIVFSLLLLIFGSQIALAFTPNYTDVPSAAWYAPQVERLKDEGIVDAGEFFRPADSLNRAELIKMLITTIDGLKDYTPPPNPTFDDVRPGEWYTNYIEAAATLGITTGYADAEGNLTGLFGPGDPVTRAAATKMLVQAFDLKKNGADNTMYPDVSINDWFYDYVSVASSNKVVSGYDNGRFGPADLVTRAQIAKMLVFGAQVAGYIEDSEPVPAEEPAVTEDEPEEEFLEEDVEEEAASGPLATPNPLTIEEVNAPAGSEGFFVARYTFRARLEEFRIETVTIVNDILGDKLGDQAQATTAIKEVTIKYPDKDGLLATETQPLGSDGRVRFSNLSFYAYRGEETFFEIYASLNEISEIGEGLSGEVFRLGLQDTGNDSQSYRAVGDVSGSVVGFGASRLNISNSDIHPFTVRKTIPVFGVDPGSQNMTNGMNKLLSFDISASKQGSVALGRLVFEVNVFDASGGDLNLSDFKLYRGSNYLSDVHIYDATGAQDLTLGNGGILADGTAYVIVAFDSEETISAGSTNVYSLRASVFNADSNDSVNTRIAQDDEETALSGLTSINQPNTGKIYVNGDATAGIFTGPTDFMQSLGTAKNVIWSDKSAKSHLYPGISGGAVTSDSGSADWTNGYQLDLIALPEQLIEK